MAAAHLDTREDGATTVARFSMPQPIPAYLFAFGVGDFHFRELGPRTGIYAEPEILDAAAWEFAENEQKIIEAEKLLGPYLWDRYDLLIMPPSFPFGAMENPRLTFMSPIFIVGNRGVTNIVTHELAHAWTGNLVTNATWEDFWLNEGWTTYAESRISDVIEGVDWSRLSKKVSRLLMFEAMKRFGMESDETKLKYSQEGIDPDDVFSAIPYHKGCAFVMALEEAVGQQRFDEFIKTYISTFSFKSLSTEGFVDFLRQELPEVFGLVDVQEWLYAPGFPSHAPVLVSSMYDQVQEVLAAYHQGRIPSETDVSNWHREQVLLFLRSLDQGVPVQDCRAIEDLFGFRKSDDAGLVAEFLLIAIRSGYREALPSIEKIVSTVGRSTVILRLFRLMVKTDWIRDLARPLFERYHERHHPATVCRLENILSRAGL
jgi:aminopeptidase N